ncbi:ABC transporter ATP-binding protein [Nakamurella aerolata]|uniref:energy-coupling factor ABC transporter ATP-binding protein n=1 Tax=Nakamurella aerolata TaxID=1656892 RepID=UPI0031B5AD0F
MLHTIDLRLTEHRIGVVGGNGSGKSTLARMINGLVTPDSGRVLVNGLDVAKHGAAVRRQVGFVFTDPDSQIVMPTVAEDVAFSLRRSTLSKAEVQQRVDNALRQFGLAGHADHPTHLLSGGQKQLLALAAMLVRDPQTLVCDEPTTLLDLRNTRMVNALLRELPVQLILVTHQLDLLTDMDRVLVVHEGRIAADGPPEPTLARYHELVLGS